MEIVITTERLTIRDHVCEDLDGVYRLLSDAHAMRYIMDLYVEDEQGAMENLQTAIQAISVQPREKYFFAVVETCTGHYVGEIGFTVLERAASGCLLEMGYFVLPEYWGRGIVTEAAKACVDYAFAHLSAHKISIGCLAENIASEKIMLKLGAVKEAHHKNHQWHEGRWKDRVVYGLLK